MYNDASEMDGTLGSKGDHRMTAQEKAQSGLSMLKDAMIDFLAGHPEGVQNVEVAEALGLRSDLEGKQRNKLSWSVLDLLISEGKVRHKRVAGHPRYYLADQDPFPLTDTQKTELERRLADDDANPDDGIPWETVHAEAEARAKGN